LPEVFECDVLILAGGLGTRMRSVSGDGVSKVMLPVGGIPVLEHVLRLLAREGFRNVIVCVGYARESVMEYCRDGSSWGLRLTYSVEQSPLGTGGAVLNALHAVDSTDIVILNGDTLIEDGLAAMVADHRARRADVTLAVSRVDDRLRYGALTLDGTGRVVSFDGKGYDGPGNIYSGCCVVTMAALQAISGSWQGTPTSLEVDILPLMIREHTACGYPVKGSFIDTGTPEDYERAQHLFTYHG
jgi:NDP-sugar pyrophosphorylase family protein